MPYYTQSLSYRRTRKFDEDDIPCFAINICRKCPIDNDDELTSKYNYMSKDNMVSLDTYKLLSSRYRKNLPIISNNELLLPTAKVVSQLTAADLHRYVEQATDVGQFHICDIHN